MDKEELKIHCSIGCAECHRTRRAINPIFEEGDIVSFNSPMCCGHGMKGVVKGNSRCEVLNSNSYDVFHEQHGNITGYHEKDRQLLLEEKQRKLA